MSDPTTSSTPAPLPVVPPQDKLPVEYNFYSETIQPQENLSEVRNVGNVGGFWLVVSVAVLIVIGVKTDWFKEMSTALTLGLVVTILILASAFGAVCYSRSFYGGMYGSNIGSKNPYSLNDHVYNKQNFYPLGMDPCSSLQPLDEARCIDFYGSTRDLNNNVVASRGI